jgi:hypothetical protein
LTVLPLQREDGNRVYPRNHNLTGALQEMVDFGSEQGRSEVETAGVAALR